jgi:hypothetical protein
MNDHQHVPVFQSLQTLAQAIEEAVRRGALDLGTAVELLEYQTAIRFELTRLLTARSRRRVRAEL